MKKTALVLVSAAAALVLSAGSAAATVTFDPSNGTGFAGKGDVQLAFGWNNAAIQKNFNDVTFNYSQTEDAQYAVTCEFDTGQGEHIVHHVTNKKQNVSDSLAYDVSKASRKNPQGDFTGYFLTGWVGDPVITSGGDDVPAVGDSCPGNSDLGLVTDVQTISDTTSGGLYANYGLSSVLIWSTPTA